VNNRIYITRTVATLPLSGMEDYHNKVLLEKRTRDNTRKRLQRANETEEQRRERLEKRNKKDRERRAQKRPVHLGKRVLNENEQYQQNGDIKRAKQESGLILNVLGKRKLDPDQRLQESAALKRLKRASESAEQRKARLKQHSNYQKMRLASESDQERNNRLQRLSKNQKLRLAKESEEKRSLRLQQLSTNQSTKLATESEENRSLRLQKISINKKKLKTINLHEKQHNINNVLNKFHEEMSALKYSQCLLCMESFPGLKINNNSECLRCSRDKYTPRVYSKSNNMHPGSVPLELQVSF